MGHVKTSLLRIQHIIRMVTTIMRSGTALKYGLITLTLFGLIFLLQNISNEENWKDQVGAALHKFQSRIESIPFQQWPPTFHQNSSFCSYLGRPVSPSEALVEREILDLIEWPRLPSSSEPLTLSQSSDPAHSPFSLIPSKNGVGRHVGETLEALVHMHDFKGRPKRYGGDFLLARLHWRELEAGVAGHVLDHGNGLYTVRFPLLWEGWAQAEVMAVHSSEAVAVLRRLRETRSDRVFFISLFRSGPYSKTTECNVCLPQNRGPLCNFTDLRTGEPWYCYKPKGLSCDTRINHAKGGYLKKIITKKEALLFQSGVNLKVLLPALATDTIKVLPSRKVDKDSWNLDPLKLATSGYYYLDSWRPLDGLAMRRFDTPSDVTRCLTNKRIDMYGDSTMRQWFEYLVTMLPEMNEYNLQSQKKVGPLMAVDSSHNILLQYRCHGPPIRFTTVAASELRYIANELDGLSGGPDAVVAISIWAHFNTFPVELYIRRLNVIRRAVMRLLERAPDTAVVVRGANPQKLGKGVSEYGSDWFAWQLDQVLRATFKDLDVLLVDAWQMCVAHRHPHNVHPPVLIVKSMVDAMLSYVCRKEPWF
ncbi:NXPE family member 3 [Stigmatopora nigra]